ncbi:MAG: hypothetical protein HKN70_05440 [Gammaproteobacteria bacterium]|nr:hypothetical protein [Gammaproteobacteria bacterium]
MRKNHMFAMTRVFGALAIMPPADRFNQPSRKAFPKMLVNPRRNFGHEQK